MSYIEQMNAADIVGAVEMDGETVSIYRAGLSDESFEHTAVQNSAIEDDMDYEGRDVTQKLVMVRWLVLQPTFSLSRGCIIRQADGTSWTVRSVVNLEFGVSSLVVADRGLVTRHGSVGRRPLPGGPIQ